MNVKRSELLVALREVKPGLATSEMIEQSTSFVFKDGRVVTYNDEIAASYPFDLGFEGAVSARELMALLNKVKDSEIEMTADKGELLIKGKKIEAGITMQEEIHLPILTFTPAEGFYELPDKFLDGLKICLFSAAHESVSPVLSNIHMKSSFIESCDNFRLTRFEMGEDSEDDILIPATAARHLVNTTVDSYGEEGGWMFFKHEKSEMVLATRIYDDEYPDLGAFLDVGEDASEVKLPQDLPEVLERSGIFASAEDRELDLVDVEVADNWIKVKSENDRGWIQEKIRAKTKGADLYFSVNPSILRDILKITDTALMTDKLIRFNAPDFAHVVTLRQPEKE